MRDFLFLGLITGLLCGCVTARGSGPSAEARLARGRAVVKNWCRTSALEAQKLMEEYGPPDKIEPARLTWRNKSPWRDIAIWDNARCYALEEPLTHDYYDCAATEPDNMEQGLSYAVPADKRKALADFSDKLVLSRLGHRLSVRGNSEALNVLRLNLANEIVKGGRNAHEARSFYDRICRLTQAGKASMYTNGLMFTGP
jgi:hypothetical protein